MSDAKSELAPTGVLRAGINLSNFLLVTGKSPSGDPTGVAPDMAREIAQRLGVPVKYVTFPTPGELADAAGKNLWDIGLIGAEPQRAETIAFTPAYVEIEATYLVPAGFFGELKDRIASVHTVPVPGGHNGLDPAGLAATASRAGHDAKSAADPAAAVAEIVSKAGSGPAILLIAGSLYLAGSILEKNS